MAKSAPQKLLFPLPVYIENYGRGYVTLPQECENVNWWERKIDEKVVVIELKALRADGRGAGETGSPVDV